MAGNKPDLENATKKQKDEMITETMKELGTATKNIAQYSHTVIKGRAKWTHESMKEELEQKYIGKKGSLIYARYMSILGKLNDRERSIFCYTAYNLYSTENKYGEQFINGFNDWMGGTLTTSKKLDSLLDALAKTWGPELKQAFEAQFSRSVSVGNINTYTDNEKLMLVIFVGEALASIADKRRDLGFFETLATETAKATGQVLTSTANAAKWTAATTKSSAAFKTEAVMYSSVLGTETSMENLAQITILLPIVTSAGASITDLTIGNIGRWLTELSEKAQSAAYPIGDAFASSLNKGEIKDSFAFLEICAIVEAVAVRTQEGILRDKHEISGDLKNIIGAVSKYLDKAGGVLDAETRVKLAYSTAIVTELAICNPKHAKEMDDDTIKDLMKLNTKQLGDLFTIVRDPSGAARLGRKTVSDMIDEFKEKGQISQATEKKQVKAVG